MSFTKQPAAKNRGRRERYKAAGDKAREVSRLWQREHPEVDRARKLAKLGWTLEMVETTKNEQGGRCAVCRQLPSATPGRRTVEGTRNTIVPTLVADHKHANPPEPRALLCTNCNTAIGLLMDNPELCEAAAEYLRAWGE